MSVILRGISFLLAAVGLVNTCAKKPAGYNVMATNTWLYLVSNRKETWMLLVVHRPLNIRANIGDSTIRKPSFDTLEICNSVSLAGSRAGKRQVKCRENNGGNNTASSSL
jgi:hypothetical protein